MKISGFFGALILLWTSIAAAADPPALSFHTITNDDRGEPHRRNRDISGWTYEEDPWLTEADLVAWNLDTGRPSRRGEYGLADRAVDRLRSRAGERAVEREIGHGWHAILRRFEPT